MFYILNDFDKPHEKLVVELDPRTNLAYYVHETMYKDWKNNGFKLDSDATSLSYFGFAYYIRSDIAVFTMIQPSIATYNDGKLRLWQGERDFTLIPLRRLRDE